MKPLAGALLLVLGGGAVAGGYALFGRERGQDQERASTTTVTISGVGGTHRFAAELADDAAEQERGLMYRTNLKPDGGMLFAPYPPDGSGPKIATFWMKNTPSPLDLLFIRADGTIAQIAENAVPFSEEPISSGEPVAAVLEVPGGRAAELDIQEGDRASWPVRR